MDNNAYDGQLTLPTVWTCVGFKAFTELAHSIRTGADAVTIAKIRTMSIDKPCSTDCNKH